MNEPFQYNKYVTGKNFIGRTQDCHTMANLLKQEEHIAIYEPPKSGKMSIIQQTILKLRKTEEGYTIGNFSVLNIRDLTTFLNTYVSTILNICTSTATEANELLTDVLSDTGLEFDNNHYSETGNYIDIRNGLDQNEIESLLDLPFRLTTKKELQLLLLIEDFQNISLIDNGDVILKGLEKVISKNKELKEKEANNKARFSFLFTGSMLNAMKEIFEVKKYFFKMVEHLPLHIVDEAEIIDYITKGFSTRGKVIVDDILLPVCRLFKNNVWYINHFISICDSLSRGYISNKTYTDALEIMISIHEPRFTWTVNNLTTFQLSLLKAIIDGNKKFSSADIIKKYHLNSSANVKRLKDALMKKEIITFNDLDEPIILDPLFEHWIKEEFFGIKQTENNF